MKTTVVKHVVFHTGPHLDEILAYWFARIIGGEKVFPGITTAELLFWNKLQGNMSETQFEKAGYLLLGIGHGRFDDKLQKGGEKKGNRPPFSWLRPWDLRIRKFLENSSPIH